MKNHLETAHFSSDRPVAVNPFAEKKSIETAALDPKSFDDLPLGITTFSENVTFAGGREAVRKRKIEIVETPHGRAITKNSYAGNNNMDYEHVPEAGNIMRCLGYLADDYDITAIPTPQSVDRAAREHGVELAFFRQYTTIPGREYLATFANRQFPVSLNGEYEHDISDDHLTTMVLGGKPLQDALADIGEKYSAADEDQMKIATEKVDNLTAMLRVEIADFPFLEDFLRRSPDNFYSIMGYFAVSSSLTAEIIEHTRESAKDYGLIVKP